MPFFRDKKILFIHIPKNAGMFVEKKLGIPREIVTYRKPTDKETLYLKVRKIFSKIQHNVFNKKNELEKRFLYGNFAGAYNFQHASLSEIIEYRMLSKDELNESTLLAVHRNPVDRTVSIYKYWGFYKFMSFEVFCKTYVSRPDKIINNFGVLMHLKTQVSYVNNSLGYEKKINWLSFESIEADLTDFLHLNNIKIDGKVNRSDDVAVDVSETARRIIENIYEEDFNYFGYS